jgi:hypothetical protein
MYMYIVYEQYCSDVFGKSTFQHRGLNNWIRFLMNRARYIRISLSNIIEYLSN